MSGTGKPDRNHNEAGQYEIRMHGHLDDRWSNWFEDFTITQEPNGDTLIIGLVSDQAALFGLLRKVRDIGMPLVSVNRVSTSQAEPSDD